MLLYRLSVLALQALQALQMLRNFSYSSSLLPIATLTKLSSFLFSVFPFDLFFFVVCLFFFALLSKAAKLFL